MRHSHSGSARTAIPPRRSRARLALGSAAIAFMLGAAAVPAQDHRGHIAAASEATEPVAVPAISIPDVLLRNQDGEEIHFYSDLVQGHVVAINFIFTTCTTICPPMGANFSRLQRLLQDRGDEDVRLISVSVDPAVDTPARLKEWAAKFGARPGWTLVTGPKPDVDGLLKKLKVFTPDKEGHSPIVLVGNDARSQWTRIWGLAPPTDLARVIDQVIGAPGTTPMAGGGEHE